MLFKRRKELRERAEREAAGESFWTAEFSESFRHKVKHAFDHLVQNHHEAGLHVAKLIAMDEGKPSLTGGTLGYHDAMGYLLTCPHDVMPSMLEAIYRALLSEHERTPIYHRVDDTPALFQDFVKRLLAEDRISYDMVKGELVEKQSQEMHAAVVEPALTLLADRKRYPHVETAYRAALEQLSKGEVQNAITDAGTALQQMLSALGCSGKVLGDLIKDARRKGLFGGHDNPLLEVIEKTCSWAAADRNVNGDTHNVKEVQAEDAWLLVHVVGALILRLAGGTPRPTH